jgi:hypothetical protein
MIEVVIDLYHLAEREETIEADDHVVDLVDPVGPAEQVDQASQVNRTTQIYGNCLKTT